MRIRDLRWNLVKSEGYSPWVRVPTLVLSSWLFQGILYMDRTEKYFKLGLDVLMGLGLYFLGFRLVGHTLSIVVSMGFAHTMNWVFNGQVCVLLKDLGWLRKGSQVNMYLEDLERRIRSERSILAAATYGSLARDELSDTSDLDIRVLRSKGLSNGLRACLFVLRERSRAFLKAFPLDIYVIDDSSLATCRMREDPIIIWDPKEILTKLGRPSANTSETHR